MDYINFPQMYDWSKHKIGIVLSGGGAKGAYEIGCWEALAKAGLTFNAIAGTSIGGINGYLMSVASIKEAKSVWIQMGRSSPLSISIFRLSVFFLERLGLLCAMILIVFVLIPAAEVVSVPAMVPRWVFKTTRFLPNKSWEELTAEDLDHYREALSRLGLGDSIISHPMPWHLQVDLSNSC
jgi:hypothetical protein